MSRLINEILTSQWLIDIDYARSCTPLLMSLVKGEKLDNKDWGRARSLNRPFIVSKIKCDEDDINGDDDDDFPIPLPPDDDDDQGTCKMDDDNIPAGSIAVIPIRGEIMKYDEFCGPVGTLTLARNFKDAIANANIASIVIVMDSPGGQVSYTDLLSDIIAKSSKPIVGFVEGIAASGGFWIISGSTKIICSSDIDRVGSFGTMTSFADLQPYFEKEGVVFHEFEATKSTDKNADIKEIRAGNYDNYRKNVLDVINEEFLSDLQVNRPGIDKTTLTGKMYFAPDAIKLGIIDEIGTFEYAIQEANRLAKVQSINNNSKNLSMKIKANGPFSAIMAFFGLDAAKDNELTEDQLAQLNNELQARGDKIAQFVSDATAHATQIDTLTKEVSRLNGEVTSRDKNIETLTTQVNELSDLPGETEAKLKAEKEANHGDVKGGLEKAVDFCQENGDDINACLAHLDKIL
jgi:protease-4